MGIKGKQKRKEKNSRKEKKREKKKKKKKTSSLWINKKSESCTFYQSCCKYPNRKK